MLWSRFPNPQDSASDSYKISDSGVFRLGGAIELDGRVSWAPALPGRYQPINCYLIFEGERAYLIDTGLPLLRGQVVEQLTRLVPSSAPLTVTMTRAEYECSGNIGAVNMAHQIDEIIAGGIRNPFDAYDEVSQSVAKPAKRQRLDSVSNTINSLGSSKRLVLISPRFRILTTYWLYDSVSKTLFTSDAFGHTSIATATSSPAIRDEDSDTTTLQSARDHLLAKYSWLPLARTGELVSWLETIFEDFEIENVAPTHGAVLQGRAVVERHLALLVEILNNVGQPSPKQQ